MSNINELKSYATVDLNHRVQYMNINENKFQRIV